MIRKQEKSAAILGLEVEEFGKASIKSENPVSISSTCVVFAESEIISARAKDNNVGMRKAFEELLGFPMEQSKLDTVFAGALDAITRINMQNEVLRIWKAEKKTMILVTHDNDEAIYLGDKM